MKNVVLDDWQTEILNYDGNIVVCTGRQNGKTFIMSRKIGNYLRKHKGCKIIVVSLTEDQAKLMIVMTLDYLERTAKKDICTGTKKPTQNKIELRNGSQVIARPVGNTGDAIRGFTGDVLVLDECSRLPEMAIEAGRPTLFSTSGQIWMCSTPFGKKGYFYESFEDARTNSNSKFKYWWINSEKVAYERPISEGWTEEQRVGALKHLEDEKKSKSKTYYGQEYLAQFLDDLTQYFEDELLNRVMTLGSNPNMPGERFLGVDLARFGGDEIAFVVVTKSGGKCYMTHFEAHKLKPTDWSVEKVLELDRIFNFQKIGLDVGAGTIGVAVWDYLMKSSIRHKCVAMNNREIVVDRLKEKKQRLMKEDYYENLKAMMEHGEIQLINDDQVRLSLKSVQWEIVKEDDAASRIRIFGLYTHITEALHRAAYLAKAKNSNSWIKWF